MPYRRLPNTTPAVIRTLRTAHDTWEITIAVGDKGDPSNVSQQQMMDASAPTNSTTPSPCCADEPT